MNIKRTQNEAESGVHKKYTLKQQRKKKKLAEQAEQQYSTISVKNLDKMSAKVAAAITDGSPTNAVGSGANNSINTNGTSTPGRRLRARNSNSSGNLSGSDSATKKTNNERGGSDRNSINYNSDTNANNITVASSSSNHSNSSVNDEKQQQQTMASKKYHNPCPHLTNSTRKVQIHTQPHSSSSFDMSKNEEFNFDAPAECPVFRPTPEEFKNPLAYISKIRPIAEKCGIAKILPPELWSPPFAVDVDKLKFTPRVQRLNELEAKTRVKLNFLDQIAKFWELQGSSLKIPMVERKALDLYTLHRIVQEEGGMEQTTKDRKWAKVANRMSYPSSKSVGATLKAHYERILHPFEVYTSGKVLNNAANAAAAAANANENAKQEVKLEDGTDYKAHEIPTRQQIVPPNENNARRSKRFANSSANCGLGSVTKNGIKHESKEEFKRDLLHAFNNNTGVRSGKLGSGESGIVDPLMKYICHICNRGDVEESMLLCDGCDDSYHTFCLLPPLSSIPKGNKLCEWLCPRCVVEEVSKPQEAFGFEQAEREYTLQQFGQMADQFKMDYFRKPVHMVPTDLVEREFWRIVSSIDEDVTVEYGADLHTMDHGSGFPTKSSLYLLPGDQEYAESSWNLNNLPLLEDSILGHINADISGMNAPWMYVGMCFAAFCWHNEDHWSYSINYLHWGEPKTWYGVPGSCAEQFEETMKQAAPELFASQPDLLHQLVTIMNPNILMNNGVPVYRTDQHAGEFVITFPRAYHAGFNQGYNFAEAVNFAPADWLRSGRECVNHYSMLRRFCVFSHDELVCKMALEPAKLTFGIATACYIDMADMVDSEKKLRKSLLEWGVTRAERKAFELVPDDERHCQECNTTCFLSAVSCECTKAIVCLRHYTVLCCCAPEKHTLLYRYTLDEMPLMLQKLKAKAESFERWLSRCRDIVDANTPTTVSLAELQELCKEAETKKYPSSLLIDRLNGAVLEAEKCVTVIQQLGINKVRTRSDNNLEAAQYKLTMEELELFVQEIDNLCCIIDEGASVRELLMLGKQFVERAEAMLKLSLDAIDEQELEALISEGNALRIELTQMSHLNGRLKQLKWYKLSLGMRNANNKISYADIHKLLKEATGELVPSDAIIDKEIRKLHEIGAAIEAWEKHAAIYFQQPVQQHQLADIDVFLKTASEINGQVPSYAALKEALRKAREWLRSIEQLHEQCKSESNPYPQCHLIEALEERGRNIPIQLAELTLMQSHLKAAYGWRKSTSEVFLKNPSWCTLLEVLMPRLEAVIIDCDLKTPFDGDFVKELSPAQILEKYKIAEEQELRDMRELRCRNILKQPLRDNYCLCKQPFNGYMFNCQLCCDWFHEECMQTANATASLPLTNGKSKWLCPSCMRTKRPRLENILPILVNLQNFPIRMPEEEALRCLAERAMAWQERARKVLASPDVTAALELIAQYQNKNKSQTMRKVRRTASQAQDNIVSDAADSDDDEGRLHIVEDSVDEDEEQHHSEELQRVLSSSEVEQLVDLMLEGDIVEVCMDETQELWRLVSIVHPCATPEANVLVEEQRKYQLRQSLISNNNSSALNSTAEDSNDSLIVQGSPSNNTSSNNNSLKSNANSARKRRSNEQTGSSKKRNATQSKYQNNRKNARKNNDGNNKPNAAQQDDSELVTPTKQQQPQQQQQQQQQNQQQQTNNTNANISGNKSENGSTKKRKRTNGNGNNENQRSQVGQKKNAQRAQVSSQQEDDEEECRAENCHKPTGREVDWVQCDGGCNEWFHMYCVGLMRSQIKADDDYICVRCSQKESRTTSPTNNTTNDVSSTTNNFIVNNNNNNNNIMNDVNFIANAADNTNNFNNSLNNVSSTTTAAAAAISTTLLLNNNNISSSNKTNNITTTNTTTTTPTFNQTQQQQQQTTQQYNQLFNTNNANSNNNNNVLAKVSVTGGRVQSTVR